MNRLKPDILKSKPETPVLLAARSLGFCGRSGGANAAFCHVSGEVRGQEVSGYIGYIY